VGPLLSGETDRLQVAALCWRKHPILEVLLVTSLTTRRWILPKGWPHPGLSLAQSAAQEAQEEAGVTGLVEPAPLGSYHYLKEKGGGAIPCRVAVFSLAVTGHQHFWTEKGARELLWLPAGEAVRRVSEPGLRHILQDFRKSRAVPQRVQRRG
jgi:8-oxo-dGTP pyrophosphatase MutT (NUDIX family)